MAVKVFLIFGTVLFHVSCMNCFSPSDSGLIVLSRSELRLSVVPQSSVKSSHRTFVGTSLNLVPAHGAGTFGYPRIMLASRKLCRPPTLALAAARQQDDEDDEDEIEITTYLSCPKCMADHFILRDVLGEGRHVP
jgi:hypothetical protein